MSFLKQFFLDRFTGSLSAQLLSSQTTGTFQLNTSEALGSQLATMTTGMRVVITIEDEQILCSGFSVSGSTVTCTIATNGRGYSSTTAATHASSTAAEIHLTKANLDNLGDEVENHIAGVTPVVTLPTITSATVLSVAGVDVTSIYTVGRVIHVKISSTWYRCVVRSSSFSTNTTINVSSDSLPGSGTVADCVIALAGANIRNPVDLSLIKVCTNVPTASPPTGYFWLVAKAGGFYSVDENGYYRFLGRVKATVSSSSGVLALDGAVANTFEITLTENVTSITLANFIDGQAYILIVKQHASSAKTVSVPAAFRFGTTLTGWTMTSTVAKRDYVGGIYCSADSKLDILAVMQAL